MKAAWKVSVRKACAVLRIDRSLYTYKPCRGDQAGLKKRIKEITEVRVRYGYRRVHVLLRREGWAVNPKRIIGCTRNWAFKSATRCRSDG